jgi:hypothetical protein
MKIARGCGTFLLILKMKLQSLKEAKSQEITSSSTEIETLIYSAGYNTLYCYKKSLIINN